MQQPTTAGEIMLTRLVTLHPDEPVVPSIAKLLDLNITGAPVVEDRCTYLGVFAERSAMNFFTNTAHLAEFLRRVSPRLRARDIMSRETLSLAPEYDACDAISLMLAKGVSGALVIDPSGRYLGVFSEKTGMSLLIGAAYDQLPTCRVDAFMDTDRSRLIDEDRDVVAIMETFLETHLRRLPVMRGSQIVGQITRRDVLKACMATAQGSQEAKDPTMHQGLRHQAQELCVGDVMDRAAKTIGPDLDLLSIAEIFLTTPYRRLSVVRDGELLGLVRRRDLMRVVDRVTAGCEKPVRRLLYLSALGRGPTFS